jgi:putative Mg2+ transporter-C (MgtC) family protein
MILSQILSVSIHGEKADPTRIAAQVVTGVGFLGAGAIMQQGLNVTGLTTAAVIWVCAGIGLAIGAGHIFLGILVTLLILLVLELAGKIEKKIFPESKS